jgi:glycosyltransferase involved in cell wall biosynthesis
MALSEEEIANLSGIPDHNGRPFRVVSIGSLLHLKGFDLGLQAFAQFHQNFPASEYWVIGEGPERTRLLNAAKKLHVSSHVCFLGSLPRTETMQTLAHCDVVLHPVLHDSGGWVSLEAMAAGRPVICLDLGGPALQVTADTGVKVSATSPAQVICDLAAALERLAKSSGLRKRLGRAARERVRDYFNWQRKADELLSVYHIALSSPPAEPENYSGAADCDLREKTTIQELSDLANK